MRRFDIRFKIDPAREMLEILCRIEQGLPWNKRALKLLADRSYRYVMFTINTSRLEMMKVLESLSEGGETVDLRLRWLHEQLLAYLDRLDDISTFLDELGRKKNEIIYEASSKAQHYLPESSRIEADIYLVIGGSDAYGVNLLDTRAIVINIGLFVSHMEELVAMMAHELHHKAENWGREIHWRLHRNGPQDLERVYSLVCELIGEGLATLVTFPFGFAHKYFHVRENINGEYRKVEDGIQQVWQDITNEKGKEVLDALYAHAGPLYMVGCDMAKKVEDALGREELIDASQEPLLFFQTYMRAVNKSGKGYRFSINTLDIVKRLQEKINLL